jgi:lysophospholipase L1-like esterase
MTRCRGSPALAPARPLLHHRSKAAKVADVGFRKRLWRVLLFGLYPILALTLAEASCQVVYRALRGSWRLASFPGDQIHFAFRKHPYLVGVPRPGFSRELGGVRVSHNSRGQRGPEIAQPKRPGVVRIAALGGSTTYGAHVSDDETWPFLLGRSLGDGYEVINLGVLGYSTVEHVIQTALHLSDLSPDIAIYFVGWNDIRNSHVAALEPDYSNFHAPYLEGALGLFNLRIGNHSALVFYLKRFVESALLLDPVGPVRFEVKRESFRKKIDPRVLSLFRRNLESIIALCRQQGIRPILVPQVLNYSVLSRNAPTKWTPTLAEKDLKTVLAAFNQVLVQTARDEGVDVVASVLHEAFEPADFVDHGHFTKRGNEKFARLIASYTRPLK